MRLFATAFQAHATFSELLNSNSRYQGFILDQFGVLHNGQHALPGAVELVEHLAKANKKLIILSNTSSPAHTTLQRLPGLGFNPDHFIGAVTSGDEASRLIRETYGGGDGDGGRGDDEADGGPRRFVWFTWGPGNTNAPSPLHFLKQCGNVEPTLSVEEADFVVAHGSGVVRGAGLSDDDGDICFQSMESFLEDGDLTEIDKVLKQCLDRNLPMICANPDFVVQYGDGGGIRYMPGNIARRYQEMGGRCTTFGKPHSEHFEACIRELGLDKEDVAHVGDSLHHDIAGANLAGIPSIFITGGIHSDELEAATGDMPDEEILNTLFEREGATPTHVLPMFRL
mmetsp:Transcript_12445/g.35623  ORF Transcript_12445/g.35623 Transcript_12445/m.35623 type:complete len:340 (+) Transcript_12445:101-1120(+)